MDLDAMIDRAESYRDMLKEDGLLDSKGNIKTAKKINVDYYPTWHDITVQFGWWDNDYFTIEYCNHAGNLEKEQAYTFDGFFDSEYYTCTKCDETFDVWEIESDDDDELYQAWKDSQL